MNRRRPNRRGVVTVEFALAAPILFTFVFAGIEFSRVNLVRNTVENAAYEGARRGIVGGATADECRQAAQDLLDILSIQDATVIVTPSVIDSSTENVSVSIQVPLTQNSYVTPQFYLGKSVYATTTLSREQG